MNTAYFIDSNAYPYQGLFNGCVIYTRADVPTYKSALDLVAKKKPMGIQMLPSGIFVVPELFAVAVSVGNDDSFIFYNK